MGQADASASRVMRDLGKAEMLRAAQTASLNRFNVASISNLNHVERHEDDTRSPLHMPHASQLDGTVMDENFQPVQWPWTPSTSNSASSCAVSEAAIAAHVFNSARTVRQKHRLDDMIELCLASASIVSSRWPASCICALCWLT